ncbi:methyltransferase, FkbM family [Variovorax sp. YR266]|uniref:FkbM family methyltransferase n=1 Tax=Variovorax sp. YR266 TaxID=1884386 RepID=UPI00089BC16F|nr:FkbM family methyltransferase [Variovorax sp. YR266]SDZ71349.1 methyltransferase, FkbM family [Variovorax sp. YR266]
MDSREARSLPILIGDKTFTVTSDDEYLANMRGTFEPETVALLRTLVKPGGVALDVGANVGCTALLLSGLASTTLAFEPSRTTFNFLRMNLEAAGVKNVTAVNAGLGAEPAILALAIPPVCRGSGVVTDTPLADHIMESIEIVRGDEAVRRALPNVGVDFIKIDVEGYELGVLQGLAETLARDRPVVTFELNHWALNVFRRMTVPDFLEAVCDIFPVLYAVGRGPAVDLHDADARYLMMHEHIVHFDYMALVGAFDESKIGAFLDRYVVNPAPRPPAVDLHARVATLEAERLALEQALNAEREAKRSVQDDLSASLAAANARANQVQAELEAVRNTVSWRVTKPLRAVKILMQ